MRARFKSDSVGMANLDYILRYMIVNNIPLSQQAYLQLAFWDDRKLADLSAEEIAELPQGFENWPVYEGEVVQ